MELYLYLQWDPRDGGRCSLHLFQGKNLSYNGKTWDCYQEISRLNVIKKFDLVKINLQDEFITRS